MTELDHTEQMLRDDMRAQNERMSKTMIDEYYWNIYRRNKAFKDYIKRYCDNNDMTVEQALEHKIIKAIAEEYDHGCNNGKENK